MRADDRRVIPTFIPQALKGEPITVFGDGSQTRSFCYVDDLIEGVYQASVREGLRGLIVNLGNPEEISILDLARLIQRLLGSEVAIAFRPLPEDDPTRRCPDISKARALLNWTPSVPLEEGLQKTIEYFRAKLSEGRGGKSP